MDRQGIIQATYLKSSFTTSDSCGEENCDCDAVKTEGKKQQPFPFVTIALSALACAMVLTSLRMNVPAVVTQNKKARTISCGSRSEGQRRAQLVLYGEHQSSNNNGNCPHSTASFTPARCS